MQVRFFAFVGAVEVVDRFLECHGGFGGSRLLALHCGDHHCVCGGQFLGVVFAVGFQALRHEVLGDRLLDSRRVIFFGRDPANQLVQVLSVVLAGEFVDLSDRLFDGRVVFDHRNETSFVVVDTAGNLAVSAG